MQKNLSYLLFIIIHLMKFYIIGNYQDMKRHKKDLNLHTFGNIRIDSVVLRFLIFIFKN